MTMLDRLTGLEIEAGELLERRVGRELELDRYESDPVGFAREVLRFEPWSRQEEILRSVIENPLTVVRGANATGKDAVTFGPAILHHVFVRKGMVVAIAPTARQGVEIGMVELGKWWRKGRLPGELFRSALRIPGDDSRGVLVFTSNEVSRLTGYHHPRLLVVLTECQGLPPYVWEAALSCALGEEDRVLAVGNPLSPEGEFFRASRSSRWHQIKLPASEHPNVRTGRTVIPGGISKRGIDRLAEAYGRDSPIFRARVEAEFPQDSEESLVRVEWLEAAAEEWERWRKWAREDGSGGVGVGVDIARFGTDRSVIAVRRGTVLEELKPLPRGDTMETTGRLVLELQRIGQGEAYVGRDPWRPVLWHPGEPPRPGRAAVSAIVDEAGLGGGVVDRLRELGRRVIGFNSSFSAEGRDAERLLNLRAVAYWNLRRRLERRELAIPHHRELWEELQATQWKVHSSGRIQIQPKDEIRATLGRSPDYADAVAMAFWCGPPRSTVSFEAVSI